MPFIFPRNDKLGIAKETAYGTFVRPTTGLLVLPPVTLDPVKEVMEDASAFGTPEKKLADFVFGVRRHTAKARMKLPKENLGQLLKTCFGTVADVAHAPFTTHNFTASAVTPPSLSLLLMHGQSGDPAGWEWQLSGVMVKTLKIMGEINQALIAEIDFVGGAWVKAAFGAGIAVPVPAAESAYWHFNDGLICNITGTVYTPRSFEITIENQLADGLEQSYEIQSSAAATNDRKQLERAGNPGITYKAVFRRLVQNATAIDKFVAGASGNSSVLAGVENNTTNYYFQFQMVSSIVKAFSLNESSGLYEEVVEVEGYQSGAGDNNISYKDKQTVT